MLYFIVPKMWGTKLFSEKLANFHFWIGTLGIIFYAIPMYWAGFTQSLMWDEFTAEGFLAYPNFLETVTQLAPMYALRAFGGAIYIVGVLVGCYNLILTAKHGSFVKNEDAEAAALEPTYTPHKGEYWHRALERKPLILMVLAIVAVSIGGLIEIVPTMLVKSNIPTISSVRPYTPLELEGRDLYIREGCYNCHSQMIRPFRAETERYGEYSKAGEFVYDHPFQWGSKRTGPDLAREGGKKLRKPNSWHFNHMLDPTTMSPGSIMPPYPWLIEDDLDVSLTGDKISAMRTLGVPYPVGYENQALADLQAQAQEITNDLAASGTETSADKEIIALIAYLQRLGTDIENEAPTK